MATGRRRTHLAGKKEDSKAQKSDEKPTPSLDKLTDELITLGIIYQNKALDSEQFRHIKKDVFEKWYIEYYKNYKKCNVIYTTIYGSADKYIKDLQAEAIVAEEAQIINVLNLILV